MTQAGGPQVLVIDNFHRHDPSEQHVLKGFETGEQALIYAFRRVRSSVEQFRDAGQDRDAHYRKWMALGEECVLDGVRMGQAWFDWFRRHPASAAELDYLSLAPPDPPY